MRFILVEEDEQLIRKEKQIISDVLFQYDLDYEIAVYKSCNRQLMEEIEDNSLLKTYILSVDFNQSISGIDVAQYIRKKDCFSNIIFVTNHGNMFEMVHRKIFNVFEFIEKYQSMEKRLKQDIKKIVSYYCDEKVLKFEYKSSIYRIYYKSIKYITRDTVSRKLIIYTTSKDYECNMTIKDVLKILDKRFVRVSKSVIINKDYVEEVNVNKGYIRLLDDSLIESISKKYFIYNNA